ncbi:MAG: aminotransferase class IV [Pseudomonadota bacterium]
MTDFSKGAAWIGSRIVPITEATLPVTDWGLTHSDATYDVAPVWDGAFFRLGAYIDRFFESCAALRLETGVGKVTLSDALHSMVAASGLRHADVAMVASRGQPLIPGTRDPRHCANHMFAWCVPYVHVIPEDVAARGVRLWIAKTVHRIPDTSVCQQVKNYHWGDFTTGLFEAKDAGFDTAILTDHNGNVTEGPGFNIFAVKAGTLVTPERHCLHGITRRSIIELAAEGGMVYQTRDLPLSEFLEADEIFTCTTGGGPAPVVQVDDRSFSNGAAGPVTARLSAAYWARVADPAFRSPVEYGC